MDNISKKEKYFLIHLIKKREEAKGVSLRVKDVLFNYLNLENTNLEIKITSKTIYLENFNRSDIDLLFTLLNRLVKLNSKEYIYLYDFVAEDCSNVRKEVDELDISYECTEILSILNSNYCISEKLREFIKSRYKTTKKREVELNFNIAIAAILLSTVVNILIYYSNIMETLKKMKNLNFIIFTIIIVIIIIVYYVDFYKNENL